MEETNKAADTPQERRFPCGSCGAKLEFQPGTESLICSYCRHENIIVQSDEPIVELDFQAFLSRLENEAETTEQNLAKCDACAA